jgi:tRNA (guanine37-N1)-methyltransferase
MTYRDLLKKKLTEEELGLLPSSFDIIGNREKAVAIIEIPKELDKKKILIANAIMKKHKNVKTVLGKGSPVQGVYRTRAYSFIKGSKITEVTHAENGCRFLVDPTVAYFSPRESTERMRIVEKILADDIVMVFFAGIGPFAVEIEKKAKPSKVIAIEINPMAVEYLWKNIKLNKCKLIDVVLGDVKNSVNEWNSKCDRVIMPLPERSLEFIEDAINCLKPGGVCHFYCFSSEDSVDEKKEKINEIAGQMKKKIRFIGIQKVLPYGPRIWKYRIDFGVI